MINILSKDRRNHIQNESFNICFVFCCKLSNMFLLQVFHIIFKREKRKYMKTLSSTKVKMQITGPTGPEGNPELLYQ